MNITTATIINKESTPSRPLAPGAKISFAGIEAIVVQDFGGDRIEVVAEGIQQKWFWTFEGESCVIL